VWGREEKKGGGGGGGGDKRVGGGGGVDSGNWQRKHYILLCGELGLEEAMDVS